MCAYGNNAFTVLLPGSSRNTRVSSPSARLAPPLPPRELFAAVRPAPRLVIARMSWSRHCTKLITKTNIGPLRSMATTHSSIVMGPRTEAIMTHPLPILRHTPHKACLRLLVFSKSHRAHALAYFARHTPRPKPDARAARIFRTGAETPTIPNKYKP